MAAPDQTPVPTPTPPPPPPSKPLPVQNRTINPLVFLIPILVIVAIIGLSLFIGPRLSALAIRIRNNLPFVAKTNTLSASPAPQVKINSTADTYSQIKTQLIKTLNP